MILVIDNYDSFTYNLVQYLGELGERLVVYRNDKVSVGQIARLRPDRIVISPGPGEPKDAGVSEETIRYFAGTVPILGVCLGHQAIGEVYGGTITRAKQLMHGKTSLIRHNAREIFKGLPNPFEAIRYHSLVVDRPSLPKELLVTAETDDGEIMALRHRALPVWGVQFHPESILTRDGKALLKNFLEQKI